MAEPPPPVDQAGGVVRVGFEVDGEVQGVGFRPWTHRTAVGLGLTGFVANVGSGVLGEVEGPARAVQGLVDRLAVGPPAARVAAVRAARIPTAGGSGFVIAPSVASPLRAAVLPPDIATCAECLAEIADPADRRYRHAFANCTTCGPRLTVVEDLPYDRSRTTMAGFAMCPECAREYTDVTDRRFHAEPICCPDCGPSLRWCDAGGTTLDVPDVIAAAVDALAAGLVVAVKGVGGFHFAALASDEVAVARLRAAKQRGDKPFAVMVPDLAAAAAICDLSGVERAMLTDRAAPIVVAPRRLPSPVAPSVAPDNTLLGVLLPYSPLHHLLMAGLGAPIVLTSGNRADEPMAIDDAATQLAGIADRFVDHDRRIRTRVDDSVARVLGGAPTVLRRARGWAPRSFPLPDADGRAILGVGAESKSTFALTVGGRVVVSQHLGDLGHPAVLDAYLDALGACQRFHGITPAIVAHDLHPGYRSTLLALEMAGVGHVAVQHHHAHIAACLAEHGEAGPVIGVAFDGSGLGADGTLWGGELLVADRLTATRVGHLDPVPMPGGAAAVGEPWRMALAHLAAIGRTEAGLRERHRDQWDAMVAVTGSVALSPLTSSMGRIFDAVAALLGVRDVVGHEGQAAIGLEQLADPTVTDGYPAAIAAGPDGAVRLVGGDLVAAVVDDLGRGVDPAVISSRFHLGVVATTVAAVRLVAERTGISTVACSGGVFQNALVVHHLATGLRASGFRVLLHRELPPNDGCISAGQVVIAAARLHQ